MTRWAALAVALTVLACSDGGTRSIDTFCERYDALVADDPFLDLDVARPAEMAAAFDQLADGADALVDAAPADTEALATAYRDRIADVVDLLRGVSFDPRRLDVLEYRAAVAAYDEAARLLADQAVARCP